MAIASAGSVDRFRRLARVGPTGEGAKAALQGEEGSAPERTQPGACRASCKARGAAQVRCPISAGVTLRGRDMPKAVRGAGDVLGLSVHGKCLPSSPRFRVAKDGLEVCQNFRFDMEDEASLDDPHGPNQGKQTVCGGQCLVGMAGSWSPQVVGRPVCLSVPFWSARFPK